MVLTDPDASDEDLPFQSEPIPRHIAIIMDGNGRWARAHKRNRLAGHRAGAESVRKVVKACGAWGVEYLTLYAFSSENWARPRHEVTALMQLLKRYLRQEVEELDRNGVRLEAIGDLERLPKEARAELDRAKEHLAGNTGLCLILALSYGSRDEIARAVRSLAEQVAAGELAPGAIDPETITAALDTAGVPDPDLLIRTAGEMRLSNFLLWQASYAELYVTDTCWPDFDRMRLADAIADYQKRLRKFGRTAEQISGTESERDPHP